MNLSRVVRAFEEGLNLMTNTDGLDLESNRIEKADFCSAQMFVQTLAGAEL